jgi:hypothetical protein
MTRHLKLWEREGADTSKLVAGNRQLSPGVFKAMLEYLLEHMPQTDAEKWRLEQAQKLIDSVEREPTDDPQEPQEE